MGKAVSHRVDTQALEQVLDTVMHPRLYRALEALIVQAIASGSNDGPLRKSIAELSFQMKMLAQAQFGHDTADVHALGRIIDRTNPDKVHIRLACDAPTRQDPIAMLENRRALDSDQISAAGLYREVWGAFGRFLQITGRGYDGAGGGGRSRVLQPLEVMGQDVHDKWKHHYIPWTLASRARGVDRKRGGGKVMPEKILFEILVEGEYPSDVDNKFNLIPGSAIKCLKQELKLMMDPGAIEREEARLAEIAAHDCRRGMPTKAA